MYIVRSDWKELVSSLDGLTVQIGILRLTLSLGPHNLLW